MSSATKIIIGASAAALVLSAIAAYAWQVRRTSTYTDGDRIVAAAVDAPLRTILWQPPREVPGALNTSADEYEPRLSADGTRMVFVRGKPGANADLFESRWTTQGWSAPLPMQGINSPNDELGPELSPDGASLYFYSDRPGGQGGFDLWVAHADGTGWHEPENLGPSVNSDQNEYGPALSLDGSVLYFSSNRLRPGEPQRQRDAWTATLRQSRDRHDYDLFRVARDGSDTQKPVPLAAINTPFDEGSPCVSPAGDFLYFASDRPEGAGGFDLYRARMLAGELAAPESLGTAINSAANELDPGLSMDGFRLAFSSSRPPHEATPRDDETDAVDYGLWVSSSREVFGRTDHAAAMAALLDLLRECLPWLMLLLPLLALVLLMRHAKFRSQFWKLSLLAQCLLISLMIHAAVGTALAAWKVGSQVGEFLAQGGGNRVILASGGVSEGALLQVSGDLSEPLDSPVEIGVERASLAATPVSAAAVVVDAPAQQVEDQAAPVEAAEQVRSKETEVVHAAPMPERASLQTLRVPSEDAAAPVPEEAMMPMPVTSDAGTSRAAVAPSTVGAQAVNVAPRLSDAPLATGAIVPVQTGESEPAPSRDRAGSAGRLVAASLDASTPRLPGQENAKVATREDPVAPAPIDGLDGAGRVGESGARAELRLGNGSTMPAVARVDVDPAARGERFGDDSTTKAVVPVAVSDGRADAGVAGESRLKVSTSLPVPVTSGAAVRMPPVEPEPKPLDTLAQRAPEARDVLVKKMGGSEQTERAVGLALEWLAKHQSADGRWSGQRFDEGHEASGGAAEVESDAAMTGLSLLCFLGAGHTHLQDGPYQAQVKRGLEWLVARQTAQGDLRRDATNPEVAGETMYSHNIATVALCEAFAMTRDPKLTQPTRKAVAFMVSIQANPDPRRRAARARAEDTSVIGWQVMAMHSARRSGFSVPRGAFDAAAAWLDGVESRSTKGRYSYSKGEAASAAMTAEAMFIRQLLGHGNGEARMQESASFVLETPPRWADGAPTHYWYYATLAMFQHQGESWRAWNDLLVPELLKHQHQSGPRAGTWDPKDEWSRLGGRIYQTAICTLSLEVYYRYKAPAAAPER